MHRRKLWLFAGVVLAALALAATGAARVNGPDSASSSKAGTLVFGAEQGGGPDWCLNLILDIDCNAFWNVVFQTLVIRGPFLLTRFDRGSGITLTRNAKGWHGKKSKLDSIVFRFITNTNSEIQAIRSGEVDAIYPQPQLALADLRSQAGLKVVSHVGLQWEHIEIQEGAKGNPLAKQVWLRQALITSLNRTAAAKALYGTLDPNISVLNSLVRLTNEPGYKAHFKKWDYNPTKVGNIMKAHSCTKGGDGIYSCNGTKVSFLF